MRTEPIILGIDTSCDETSAGVVQGVTILSNIVASQADLHEPYGGVFPTVAKQAHKENILPTIELALQRAGKSWSEIDQIAVTQGPGLAPALEVGIKAALELGEEHGIPVVPINHIEGHVVSVLAEAKARSGKITSLKEKLAQQKLPALAVIVSGKHTDFILVEAFGKYQRLGWTIDDAAGEALDKIGRMLNLGYPAGPVIEEFAKQGDEKKYPFPLPMTTSGDYNLSFSGLKTFARNSIEELTKTEPLSRQAIYDFAASTQYSVFRHICHKLNKILQDHHSLGEVWLGGGVAANMQLRAMLRETIRPFGLLLKAPYTKKLCGDNGVMIGIASSQKESSHSFERLPRLSIYTKI